MPGRDSSSDRVDVAHDMRSLASGRATNPRTSPTSVGHPSVVLGALEAVRHTTPAVLLVPLFGDMLYAARIDPADLAAEHGAKPSDVAWVISSEAACRDESIDNRVAILRTAGFMIALEASGWATECHERIAALRPDFLLLPGSVVVPVTGSAAPCHSRATCGGWHGCTA